MDNEEARLRILFVGTGNSCRSQIAESWTKVLRGDVFDANGSGVEPQSIDRLAVRALVPTIPKVLIRPSAERGVAGAMR